VLPVAQSTTRLSRLGQTDAAVSRGRGKEGARPTGIFSGSGQVPTMACRVRANSLLGPNAATYQEHCREEGEPSQCHGFFQMRRAEIPAPPRIDQEGGRVALAGMACQRRSWGFSMDVLSLGGLRSFVPRSGANRLCKVDGQDPSSYSGIFWVLGRYDRPWAPERPVFGCVRYMSSENTMRKVRMKDYLRLYARGEK